MSFSPFGAVLTVSSAAGQESESRHVSGAGMYFISSDHEAVGAMFSRRREGRRRSRSRRPGPLRTWSASPADASSVRCHIAPEGKRPHVLDEARVRRVWRRSRLLGFGAFAGGGGSQAHPSHRAPDATAASNASLSCTRFVAVPGLTYPKARIVPAGP